MKHDHRASRSRRGSALVFAIIVLTGMMALSLAFLGLTSSSQSEVASAIDDKAAFLLAEAAASEALTALRSGASGSVGSQATPAVLGAGLFWVAATDLGDGRRELAVTAMSGSGRAGLAVVVEGEGSAFRGVIASREEINLSSDVFIDSYDSSLGDYASQATNVHASGAVFANEGGHVYSDADINLSSRVNVFGDATPGDGYSANLSGDSLVTGSTTPASSALDFAPIDVPSEPSSGPLNLADGTSVTLTAGTYHYDELSVGKNAELTVVGPAIVIVDELATASDSGITIDGTGGPVTFFCTGPFGYSKSLTVSTVSGSPRDVVWMITGNEPIVFNSDCVLVGGFYAPDADIALSSSNEVFGAIAANRLTMNADTRFHFDEFLLNREGSGDEWRIVSWDRSRGASNLARANRRDPFELLGVDRSALPTPANAWDL